jgi:hypothetical protein
MISIYGNCQSKEIGIMLSKSKNFIDKYGTDTYLALNYIFEKEHRPIDEIIENFKKTDLLIYQPLSEKHYPYSTDNLLKYLPDTCKKISFPYIFNDAFWGYPVAGNFKDGINGDFILSDVYDDPIQRFFYNIEITKQKESETIVKISDFILKNYTDVELFYTQNHPTPVIIKEACEQILNYLELDNDIKNLDTDEYKTYYGDFRWPYMRSSIETFNFKFPIKSNII